MPEHDDATDVPWARARALARDAGRPLPRLHRELHDALGHALAEPLTALTDLPPFDSSAMDGWAVAGPGPWRLRAGQALAGTEPEPLADGVAVGIATGAQLPPGRAAVLRREHGRVESATGLLVDRTATLPEPGRDVRKRGQECQVGEPLLPAGTTVTPAVLGLAAAAGYDRLVVHRAPTVELLVLGDELLDSGSPRGGRVRDALSPMLAPWLRGGAEVIGRRRIPDAAEPLHEALRDSAADVVITTGSTAAGPVDFLHATLAELGARLLVDSVAVRPGHPMLLAELPRAADGRVRHLVGLPGNPLAAVAGTVTLAAPLLDALGGRAEAEFQQATAAADLRGHPRNTSLVPVELRSGAAAPLPFGGPAMLRGLALADGFAAVPPGGLRTGDAVRVIALPHSRA
ncbi:molybdopterin molybdotransferase MoeA [Saccharopolyspora gregorii]|uniref:Molybdopterin molybdenumtransferase n=1 Tax=Saccharopolyspora gregorii TaxID=33914 RepID=A0ABP6RQT3_9PSEU